MTAQQIARVCHEANRGYCEALGDFSQPTWVDAPEWQRSSAVAGVEFLIANPSATAEQTHKSWCEQKEKDGWRYGEVKDAEKKEHPCMLPYSDLPEFQRVKDSLFAAVFGVLSK